MSAGMHSEKCIVDQLLTTWLTSWIGMDRLTLLFWTPKKLLIHVPHLHDLPKRIKLYEYGIGGKTAMDRFFSFDKQQRIVVNGGPLFCESFMAKVE